jgi:hypothetical protein
MKYYGQRVRSWSLLGLGLVAAAATHLEVQASFLDYEVQTVQNLGGLTAYQVFAKFDGATDTVLNAFELHNTDGSGVMDGFYHADALNGGVSSNVAGTWNPQFVLVPGAMDSWVAIGGGTGFASGNSTAADPGWGAAGFNQAGIPDTAVGGTVVWFNQNPPNLQGRVGVGPNPLDAVLLGQFVLSETDSKTLFLKIGYNDGVAGSPTQFGEGTFTLGTASTPPPTPPATGVPDGGSTVALLGLGLLGLGAWRRRGQ